MLEQIQQYEKDFLQIS